MTDIPPAAFAAARLCSVPLPRYRYVLGLHPHPLRDPGGHGVSGAGLPRELGWQFAIDLFNARYFWEAHEGWEPLWRAAPEGSPRKDTLKGLIQVAGCLLVLHLRRRAAALRLARRGVLLLERALPSQPLLWGLELERVLNALHHGILSGEGHADLRTAAFTLELVEPPSQ